MAEILEDICVFTPEMVDSDFRPVGNAVREKTNIFGTFNPGMTRLPSDNILLMVRVAERLETLVDDKGVHALRWDSDMDNFTVDTYDGSGVDISDPRMYTLELKDGRRPAILTSLSYLLPVEFDPSGLGFIKAHYDKIILPSAEFQQSGIEDARITKMNLDGKDVWYMTAVGVSYNRLCTVLYESDDGLNYRLKGMILDEQNKDAILFPGLVSPDDDFQMLTRAMGQYEFAPPPDSGYLPGLAIRLARSLGDATGKRRLLYWQPHGPIVFQPMGDTVASEKVGGGSNILETNDGWFTFFHGVMPMAGSPVGQYVTLEAFFDRNFLTLPDPRTGIHVSLEPVLIANPSLYNRTYGNGLSNIVFTTGTERSLEGNRIIAASGQNDWVCRVTHFAADSLRYVA